jgi:hypothetical protein
MNISKKSTHAKLRKAAPAEACALEKLPHITKRVCLLWGHPEFDAFTSHLMMDSRDGKRQGLPWDVAEEILFLAELRVVKRAIVASGVTGEPFWDTFHKMLANAEAAQQNLQHEWSDPLANRDFSRIRRDETDFTRPPAELQKTGRSKVKKKNWLMRLFGVR